MSRHETKLTIGILDSDVDLAVEYDFVRGRPATGPTYWSGGEPADPDEYDVQDIYVLTEKTREPAPAWLHSLLANDEMFIDMLAERHDRMLAAE